MTLPTITYGQGGNGIDCDSKTGWSADGAHESGLSATLTLVNNNIFKIVGTCDNVANEHAYYEKDVTDFSSTIYNNWMLKYRTSVSANGVGLKVVLVDDVGTQTIFGSTPQFSSSWATATGTLTTGRTVDKVRFYADDYPDTIDSGTYTIWIDFLIFYEGTFSFPFFQDIYPLKLHNNYAKLKIPGRVGTLHQYMGMDNITLEIVGDMMSGETWGGSNMTYAEYLTRFFMEAHEDPWQWLTSDLINCKVIPIDFDIGQQKEGGQQRQWRLLLEEFSLGTFDSVHISSSGTERLKYRFGV